MKNQSFSSAHDLEGRIPFPQAVLLGLQHVLAMFAGNLTPIILIAGACGIGAGSPLQVSILQNAMLVAGLVTFVQLFTIGPVGARLPVVMGTSSGFIGVCSGVAASMGGGVAAYGAILGASIIGGLFEGVLGFFLKPLRKFFPSVVTGTVVMAIGLSLISVGVFRRRLRSWGFRFPPEPFCGSCGTDCDRCLKAFHKRCNQQFLYSDRCYRGLHSLRCHGPVSAHYLYKCRGCRADSFLGFKLG